MRVWYWLKWSAMSYTMNVVIMMAVGRTGAPSVCVYRGRARFGPDLARKASVMYREARW